LAFKRNTRIVLAIFNLIGFLATAIVNALANTLPINNNTTGALSDMYPNLFVPAGLTFSVWGVIYALLAIFSVYQLILAFKKDSPNSAIIDKISFWFILASLFNIGWIFSWHYELVGISLIFMVLLFICLLMVFLRLNIGKSNANTGEKVFSHIPFSVYIGWITIATIANVTALLVDLGWNGFGLNDQFWTVLVILVGIIITLAMLFLRNDVFYSLVVDWAIIGILIKRLQSSEPAQLVVIITIAGISAISIGVIYQLIRRRKLY